MNWVFVTLLDLHFARRRFTDAEAASRVLQLLLNPRCERVRSAKHAPRGPCNVLECRYGLAEIFERLFELGGGGHTDGCGGGGCWDPAAFRVSACGGVMAPELALSCALDCPIPEKACDGGFSRTTVREASFAFLHFRHRRDVHAKIQARTAASRKHPGGALQGGCGVVRYASAIRAALGMPPTKRVAISRTTKRRTSSSSPTTARFQRNMGRMPVTK